jgi:hypothetical protein
MNFDNETLARAEPVWATICGESIAASSRASFPLFAGGCSVVIWCIAEARWCHTRCPGTKPSLLVGMNVHPITLPRWISKPPSYISIALTYHNKRPPSKTTTSTAHLWDSSGAVRKLLCAVDVLTL